MPPASSAGSTIRFPDDNRARLFLSESFARDKLKDAVVADELLFTTIGMSLLSMQENLIQITLYRETCGISCRIS